MQSIHSNVTQCSTSLLLVINLLIIVCLPVWGCFCGVCDIDIDLSIPLRFTCPMYAPRTGPSPPPHSPSLPTHDVRKHPNTRVFPPASRLASDAIGTGFRCPLPSSRDNPDSSLEGYLLYLLRAIKLTAELPRYRSPKHGSHETNPPIPKDAQGITARPGSGVSPLCKNYCRPFFQGHGTWAVTSDLWGRWSEETFDMWELFHLEWLLRGVDCYGYGQRLVNGGPVSKTNRLGNVIVHDFGAEAWIRNIENCNSYERPCSTYCVAPRCLVMRQYSATTPSSTARHTPHAHL